MGTTAILYCYVLCFYLCQNCYSLENIFSKFFCCADIFDRRSFSFSFFKFCRRFASSLFLVFFYINLSFSVNFAILIKDQLLQSGLVRES